MSEGLILSNSKDFVTSSVLVSPSTAQRLRWRVPSKTFFSKLLDELKKSNIPITFTFHQYLYPMRWHKVKPLLTKIHNEISALYYHYF